MPSATQAGGPSPGSNDPLTKAVLPAAMTGRMPPLRALANAAA
jgi:hypothetical protein